jgi:hypothetical protein
MVFAIIQAEQQNGERATGGPKDDSRLEGTGNGDTQMP